MPSEICNRLVQPPRSPATRAIRVLEVGLVGLGRARPNSYSHRRDSAWRLWHFQNGTNLWTSRMQRHQHATTTDKDFDLETFLPYLLNQAAEVTSRSFQAIYKAEYGMTRTQWRVLANLGRFGAMTARDICAISHIEKTNVSRAVAGLEADSFLARETNPSDRRVEILSLTHRGLEVFRDLGARALVYDSQLRSQLGEQHAEQLDTLLRRLISQSAVDSLPQDDDS